MKRLLLNNINLQRFADDVVTQTVEKNEEVKTYTHDEVDKLTKGLFSQDQVNAIVKDRIFRKD